MGLAVIHWFSYRFVYSTLVIKREFVFKVIRKSVCNSHGQQARHSTYDIKVANSWRR